MVINPVFSSYNPVFYGYSYQYLMVITQYLMAISQEPCIISVYEYLMVITHWEKNTGSNPLELQLPYFFRCTHFWQLGVNYGWWFIVDRVFHWYVDENVIGDNMDHRQKVAAKLLRTCGFPKVILVVFSLPSSVNIRIEPHPAPLPGSIFARRVNHGGAGLLQVLGPYGIFSSLVPQGSIVAGQGVKSNDLIGP